MTRSVARALSYCLVGVGWAFCGPGVDAARPEGVARTVVLARGLTPEQVLVLSVNLEASGYPGSLLLDSDKATGHHKLFLTQARVERLIPVGSFSEDAGDIEERLGTPAAAPIAWSRGPPEELWRLLFPRAERVVVCPAQPYRQLLQAGCLAGVLGAPFYVLSDDTPEQTRALRRQLGKWKTQTIYAIGDAPRLWRGLPDLRVIRLADEEAVAASYVRHQLRNGPIQTMVIANPHDRGQKIGVLSPLAPWIALQKRAALLFTKPDGKDVNELVGDATRKPPLARVENVILVADLRAIPLEQRPNTIPGTKDPFIEMEPLTPAGMAPFSFAVGRLFNEDPNVVALVLARERLLARETAPKRPLRALVASNAGGSLPLLETFSRNTAQVLQNRGYETETLFGHDVNRMDVRRRLPKQDIFLWEGHHNTLIQDYEFPKWTEPLQPSLMFVQSCLALKDVKVQPLLERGALCVVGSPTRIFSASGGAFSLSFFDALLHENQTVGGSLRHAKNFLMTYAMLKQKRLGEDAKLTAANLRSAWAFTLWGDPTLRVPLPSLPDDALPPVRHRVSGNTIVVTLPEASLDKTASSKYQAKIPPNGRLAGLISPDPDEDQQPLVPFVFAEVSLPKAPAGKEPKLSSRLSSRRWEFSWDARRRCGYLLAMPRSTDREELRFHITWVESPLVSAECE